MKTRRIKSYVQEYGNGDNTETYEYECPCGKGKIVEEHDNIVGFRDHNVCIVCDECSKKYYVDVSRGYRDWSIENLREV